MRSASSAFVSRQGISPARRRPAEGWHRQLQAHPAQQLHSVPPEHHPRSQSAEAAVMSPLSPVAAPAAGSGASREEPTAEEKGRVVYDAISGGSQWNAADFRSALRLCGLDFSGETVDDLLTHIPDASQQVSFADWQRFATRFPTLLDALWRFLCAAQEELLTHQDAAGHADLRGGLADAEAEARRQLGAQRRAAAGLEEERDAAVRGLGQLEGQLQRAKSEATAADGEVAALVAARDSAARRRRAAQRLLDEAAKEAAAAAAAERCAALHFGRRSAALRQQQRHAEADEEQRRAAAHESRAQAAEAREAAAAELFRALAPVTAARAALGDATARCDSERAAVVEARRALASAENRLAQVQRDAAAKEKELHGVLPRLEEVQRRQIDSSVWLGANGGGGPGFAVGELVTAHPHGGDVTLAAEGLRLPQGEPAVVADTDGDGNPRLLLGSQPTHGFVPRHLLRPYRPLVAGDTVEPARGAAPLSLPGEPWSLGDGQRAQVVAVDASGGARLKLHSGRETQGFVAPQLLRRSAVGLRVGDRVTACCGGADLVLEDGGWRLPPGEEAVVSDLDAAGNPRLRSMASGKATAGYVPRQYVDVAHVPLSVGDRVRARCGGGALCTADDGWSLADGEDGIVVEVSAHGACRVRTADGRVSAAAVPRHLLQAAPALEEGDRVLSGNGSIGGDGVSLREGEHAVVTAVGRDTVRVRTSRGELSVGPVQSRWLRLAPTPLSAGDRVTSCGGDLVVEGGRWRLPAGEEAVVCEVDADGNARLRSAADGEATAGFVPRHYVTRAADTSANAHQYSVREGRVEGVTAVVVGSGGITVRTALSRRMPHDAAALTDPLATLARCDTDAGRAEEALRPAREQLDELLCTLRLAEEEHAERQRASGELRSECEAAARRIRTAEQDWNDLCRRLQQHDHTAVALQQRAAAAAETRRRSAERERGLVERELRLREQRDLLEANEARLQRERRALRDEFPVKSPSGARTQALRFSAAPTLQRPSDVAERQADGAERPAGGAEDRPTAARAEAERRPSAAGSAAHSVQRSVAATSERAPSPQPPGDGLFQVGDLVTLSYGGDLQYEDGEWVLLSGQEAEVVAVDAEGNPKLRNPPGKVTSDFVSRALLRPAPPLPPCYAGQRVVPNNGGADLYFDEEGWGLAASDAAEVVGVDADGNPRLCNPRGETTTGFVDRRYVRPAPARAAAPGLRLSPRRGQPTVRLHWQ
eukprot:TRINITY_DN3459_c0_g1_i2.p1 TRINITY_DN3459_c0_g1~~TRINITY_DN3459_c0_g1_i2.p1  ORF type:complete len:1241 (+),score=457.07 TRINITY_DN3459_c0_g1_i2:52-3723(+)